VAISSPINVTFSIIAATCEIRKASGELVVSASAEIDTLNSRVSYAWDTTSMDVAHYMIIFWIELDTDEDGVSDFKITSGELKRYVRQVSSES
jgi:hypothetical protein